MVGDEQRAKRAIVGYTSAQLQSGLAAMEAALILQEPDLSFQAAKKYIELADLARQLYIETDLRESSNNSQTSSWTFQKEVMKISKNVEVQRIRRLPHVRGEAEVHKRLIAEILQHLIEDKVTVTFRQRGETLVVACRGARWMPEELIVAGSREALFAAARHSSLSAVKGYLLARRCEQANIRIVVRQNAVFLHFTVVRQLQMPLRDE